MTPVSCDRNLSRALDAVRNAGLHRAVDDDLAAFPFRCINQFGILRATGAAIESTATNANRRKVFLFIFAS